MRPRHFEDGASAEFATHRHPIRQSVSHVRLFLDGLMVEENDQHRRSIGRTSHNSIGSVLLDQPFCGIGMVCVPLCAYGRVLRCLQNIVAYRIA